MVPCGTKWSNIRRRIRRLGNPSIAWIRASIAFSSLSGQSDEEATRNLNAMSQLEGKKPWALSFSFGRALQQSTLKAWAGKQENLDKAQQAFLSRCKANSAATLGTYKGDAVMGDSVCESLHVKDYKY